MRKPVSKRKPKTTKKPQPTPRPTPKGPIQHVVIIVKDNHAFDNYFGRFPGADGHPNLATASDPPATDHPHDHAGCQERATGAATEQYGQPSTPNYSRD